MFFLQMYYDKKIRNFLSFYRQCHRVVGTGRDLSLRVVVFAVHNRDDMYKCVIYQF